jgi:hypothetical protein
MRIGVIADTHIYDATQELPAAVRQHFSGMDMILHAGDLVDLAVIEQLRKLSKKVVAVHGNMDKPEVIKKLPAKKVISAAGCRLGMVHGYGHPRNLAEFVRTQFSEEHIDCFIFGHSHSPMNERIKGILYFNPGSPTDKIFAPYNSVGIITLENKNIRGEIIRL